MGYTTTTWLSAEMKGMTFSTDTVVTDSEANQFIKQADAMINSKISRRYSTPVNAAASPQAFLILRNISTYIVAARLERILKNRGAKDVEKLGLKDLGALAKDMLEAIVDGTMTFPDAENAGSNIAAYNPDNDVQAEFQSDIDNW